MKKKRKKREEKESRKWRKVLSLTGRPGLHIHDFQFKSEEVEGINWRGETEPRARGKNSLLASPVRDTAHTADC